MVTIGYCCLCPSSPVPRYREIADALGLPHSKICWEIDGNDRTNLARLIEEAGPNTEIGVFGLDSLGSTFARAAEACHQIVAAKATLVVAKHSLVVTPQNSDVCLSLLASIVDMEKITRKQNQLSGIEDAKARGVFKGRKKGSKKRKPDEAKILKSKGLTHSEIASALGVSDRTVARYLTA